MDPILFFNNNYTMNTWSKISDHKTIGDAIRSNDYDELVSQLKNGANPNSMVYDWPLLAYCCVCLVNVKFMKILLDYGADVNQIYVSCLYIANDEWLRSTVVFQNIQGELNKELQNPESFEEFKFLLENSKYDLTITNNYGNILHNLMVFINDNDNVKKLYCLFENYKEQMAKLINIKNKDQNTPLIDSIKYHAPLSIIDFLIDNGADPLVSNDGYPNLFTYACYSGAKLDVIDYMLTNFGFDINTLDKDGCNALFTVLKPDIVRYLILNGINIHHLAPDKELADGKNALDFWINVEYNTRHYEQINHVEEVIHILVEFGLYPKGKCKEETLKRIYKRTVENVKNKIIKKYNKLSPEEQDLIDIVGVFIADHPDDLKNILKKITDMKKYTPSIQKGSFEELKKKYENHPYFRKSEITDS